MKRGHMTLQFFCFVKERSARTDGRVALCFLTAAKPLRLHGAIWKGFES
jgi:hypothetical protein